jgi:hypothetical protein
LNLSSISLAAASEKPSLKSFRSAGLAIDAEIGVSCFRFAAI